MIWNLDQMDAITRLKPSSSFRRGEVDSSHEYWSVGLEALGSSVSGVKRQRLDGPGDGMGMGATIHKYGAKCRAKFRGGSSQSSGVDTDRSSGRAAEAKPRTGYIRHAVAQVGVRRQTGRMDATSSGSGQTHDRRSQCPRNSKWCEHGAENEDGEGSRKPAEVSR